MKTLFLHKEGNMKFEDYITLCLKNPEFKKYWDEEITNEENLLTTLDESAIWEVLNNSTEDDLKDIVTNKGIKATVDIGTTIEFYWDGDKCPVADFLQEITDQKLKVKTLRNIKQLAIQGSNATYPLIDYIEDGIYELRSIQNSNLTRIFYFFVVGNKAILTNGYIKKSQKMNSREFRKAKKYMSEYMKRFTNKS